jgi:hypothetical protein
MKLCRNPESFREKLGLEGIIIKIAEVVERRVP